MTYGQRQRREERRLARAMAEARARYDALTPEEKAAFDERARIVREQLLGKREGSR